PYAGAAVYGFQAYQAFAEAGSTSNTERRGILLQKGGLYTAATGAEIGIAIASKVALAAGAVGATTVIAAAAAPLPYVYMGEAALESKYEATKTAQEWVETESRQLIHDWISTTSLGAGEAYRLGTNQAEIEREKKATNRKIAEALILQQQDPGKPADPDRLHYLEVICNFKPPANYRDAVGYLRDSRIYADLMSSRRKALSEQRSIVIGAVELTDARFENPDAQAIGELLQANRGQEVTNITPELKKNFDSFSDRYLIDLCCESLTLQYAENSDVTEAEKEFTRQLESYLTFVRGVDVCGAYNAWMAIKVDKREFDDASRAKIGAKARESMTQLQTNPSQVLRKDIEHHTPNRAVYAVTDLARFFGYTGYPNEEALKLFFDKDHKGVYGCYWDGDEWCLNESGWEVDEDLGGELNDIVVRHMIRLMREDPDDVIETRQQAIVDVVSIHQFNNQVLQMADILEQGLKKEPVRLKALKPASAVPSEPTAEGEIEDQVLAAAN
ncbi:MAG: hypothetical protein V1908_02275, partial [Candidatus Peregrinibacteria bacterium]